MEILYTYSFSPARSVDLTIIGLFHDCTQQPLAKTYSVPWINLINLMQGIEMDANLMVRGVYVIQIDHACIKEHREGF